MLITKARYITIKDFFWFPIFAVLGGLVFFSCAQDPIFWHIHFEQPPKESLIKGSPTNIIYLKNGTNEAVYAGNKHGSGVHRFTNSKRTLRECADGLYGAFQRKLNYYREYAAAMDIE